MSAPRVAIVGARRRRQGLGPFVARALAAAGAEVPAIVGTSPETVAAAQAELATLAGLRVDGATSLDELLERHPVDAVALLTPAETHARLLRRALDAGMSVLCEKPFVWGTDDDLATTRALVQGFAAAGLTLVENCQWPYTLPAFDTLHPGVRNAGPPGRFTMTLGPSVTGAAALPDSLPHALSLLQAVAPATRAEITAARFSTRDPDAAELLVDFSWPADTGPVAVSVQLIHCSAQPRPAGYALDGHRATRLIRLADYAQFFADGPRLVDLPDPLALLAADFVERLRQRPDSGEPRRGYAMIERMRALAGLARAYRNDPT